MHIKRTLKTALAAFFVVLAVPGAASAATTLQPGAYMETVKGWPAYPKGATVPSDTLTGDSIQLSGYGLGYGTTQPTQEQRTAVMGFDDASTYDVSGPIHWGDSGGPLVHKRTGKALGIVSRLCAGACSEEGPAVQGILAKAAAAGFPVTLRTV